MDSLWMRRTVMTISPTACFKWKQPFCQSVCFGLMVTSYSGCVDNLIACHLEGANSLFFVHLCLHVMGENDYWTV